MPTIRFFVPDIPQSRGSKRAFPFKKKNGGLAPQQVALWSPRTLKEVVMGEVKHSPLPWRVEGRYVKAQKDRTICEVPQYGIISYKVDDANRTLIAAAPDLLAACEALPLNCDFTDAADFVDNSEKFRRAMDLARAAIQKAKEEA